MKGKHENRERKKTKKNPKLINGGLQHRPPFPAREVKFTDWVQVSGQSGFIVTRTDIL